MIHSFSTEKNFLSPVRNREHSESKVRFNSQNYFKGTVCSPSANSYTRIFYSKRKKKIVKAFSPAPQKQMRLAGNRNRMVSASQNKRLRGEKVVNDENISVNSVYRQRMKGINHRKSNKIDRRSMDKLSLKKGKKKNPKVMDQKLKLYYSELDQMCRKRGLQRLKRMINRRKAAALKFMIKAFKKKKIKISISKRTPNKRKRNFSKEKSVTSIKKKLFTKSHRGIVQKSEVDRIESKIRQPEKFEYDYNNFMGITTNAKRNHYATFAHNGDDSFQKNEDYAELVVERSNHHFPFSPNFPFL